jgi:hypothetical protein
MESRQSLLARWLLSGNAVCTKPLPRRTLRVPGKGQVIG